MPEFLAAPWRLLSRRLRLVASLAAWGAEFLRPVRRLGALMHYGKAHVVPHAIQNVFAVVFTVHPGVHDLLRSALPSRNVLPGAGPAVSGFGDALGRGVAVGALVVEVPAVSHIAAVGRCGLSEAWLQLHWSATGAATLPIH